MNSSLRFMQGHTALIKVTAWQGTEGANTLPVIAAISTATCSSLLLTAAKEATMNVMNSLFLLTSLTAARNRGSASRCHPTNNTGEPQPPADQMGWRPHCNITSSIPSILSSSNCLIPFWFLLTHPKTEGKTQPREKQLPYNCQVKETVWKGH